MDVVFNALAVTFLYNLDDIGGETGRVAGATGKGVCTLHQSLRVKIGSLSRLPHRGRLGWRRTGQDLLPRRPPAQGNEHHAISTIPKH